MAISAAFLKKAKAIGDELKSDEDRRQEALAENKRLAEEDKVFLKQKAAPLFETLEELAALPSDKDGYRFSYNVHYNENIRSADIRIYGAYKNASGPKEYDFYRARGGDYERLTSTFDISAVRPNTPWNKGVEYTAQAGDTDNKEGGHIAAKFGDAKQLVEDFLASWAGRNIPDVARRLQASEQKAEKSKPRSKPTFLYDPTVPKG